MDILITDSMLREYLDTPATPQKIAECLSLCGPSIERITKEGKETVYHIEVTTNRVDAASAYGIAREAVAILPRFGIKATLKNSKIPKLSTSGKLGIDISIDPAICERFMAVKLTGVKIGEAPQFMKDRLSAVGQRPLNNAVDITNYVMLMTGIPMHAFDYKKVAPKIVVRTAKKKELFVALDERKHTAQGGEIVFDNGKGEIIDLPGIMGTKNSIVDTNTTEILLVTEHMDPLKIRSASLIHEIRTTAATINEKDPDPNAMGHAMHIAVNLFEKYVQAKTGSTFFDWYPQQRAATTLKVERDLLTTVIGVELSKSEIVQILSSLQFEVQWKGETLEVVVPTFRVMDVQIPEDIAEEVARLYGYFNLPSVLPEGAIPEESQSSQFAFESRLKSLLKGWGSVEVYTLSMVSKEMAAENAIKIKNPLGGDGEYMRTELIPSLIKAARENAHIHEPYHLFEMANVYLPISKKLPDETMHLSGVFANTDYRHAKGVLEALFTELNIPGAPVLEKQGNYFVYEFSLNDLMKKSKPFRAFSPIPKFPERFEDITLHLKGDMKVGQVVEAVRDAEGAIQRVDLLDIYEDSYTFRIYYQDKNKTLTDQDVSLFRKSVKESLSKLHVSIKGASSK